MADPFSLDVIQAGLDAAAQEMFDVLRKTAMSPIIYEVLDVGTGITDADGALISSGAGIPSFVGVLDKSVQAILAQEDGKIVEGDVFVVNDPNHGAATHLNDVVIAEPVFHGGTLVAWAASIAHWGDIGGSVPGSMSANATEIIAEGLRLPIVRLFAKGQRSDAVFDIIRTNSRLPDFVLGDLQAQLSAGRRAAKVIHRLCDRYGLPGLQEAIADARKTGEQRARAGLADLPKGRFEINEPQDDGSIWHAAIEITADQFTVDLRGAPPQAAGPHNTSRDGAVIACQMVFKALTDPQRFANAGSFVPLRVLTTQGTIFHAGPTAAHGYYFETRIRLVDMLWHCMARAMPQRMPAGHFATIFGTVIAGKHPDTGRSFTLVEPQMGGWGATKDRAGQGPLFSTSHGDTFNCPAEIAEARYGLDVIEQTLNLEDETRGTHIGGAGLIKRYQLRGPASLSAGYSHASVPVWSAPTGAEGQTNALNLIRRDGSTQKLGFVSGKALEAGDQIEIITAPGGNQ